MIRLTPLEAHGLCALLVAVDQVVRGLRIKLLFQGVGVRVPLWHAIELNLVGDAASAVTPMRLGGEPARIGVLLNQGVPAVASFVAISTEVLIMWPMLLAGGVALGWWLGPAWWDEAGAVFLVRLRELWPWILLLLAVGVAIWRVVRRHARPGRALQRPARRARVYWRRTRLWPIAAGVGLTAVNMAVRLAFLPVLAFTLADPPQLATLLVGSFALTYGQMIMPTPSGAGAIELGFLAGAAGPLGAGVLVAWRAWTLVIPSVMGAVLALRRFGRGALRKLGVRGRG